MPKVAAIVLCWNNKDIIDATIVSLQNQTHAELDIYVVDNASGDGSEEYLKATYPGIAVVQSGSNLGFAKGNNFGIDYATKQASYDYFLLLNSDATIDAHWATTMVEFAETKPTGALFQSVTLDYYNHNITDSTHIFISWNGQGTQGNWRQPAIGEPGPMRVFGVNAAAAIISQRFIEAQPFDYVFDGRMFMYLEDIDLSARATVLGWDNYLVPGTRAYHMGSASSGKNPGFSLYYTFRNNSAALMKNLPLRIIAKIWWELVVGDVNTVQHLRRIGQKKAANKVIRGRIVGLFRLPLYFADARKMARARTVDADYLYALMHKGIL